MILTALQKFPLTDQVTDPLSDQVAALLRTLCSSPTIAWGKAIAWGLSPLRDATAHFSLLSSPIQKSKIINQQSAIGNRQSAIGNRQSAIGNLPLTPAPIAWGKALYATALFLTPGENIPRYG